MYRDQLKSLVSIVDSLDVSRSEISNSELFSTMLGVSEPTEVLIKILNIRNNGCGSQSRYKSKVEIAKTKALAKEKKRWTADLFSTSAAKWLSTHQQQD